MKKFFFVIYFLLIFNNFLFAKSINFTGVCYEDVKISKKTTIHLDEEAKFMTKSVKKTAFFSPYIFFNKGFIAQN